MSTDPTTIWHREREVVLKVAIDIDAGHLCHRDECRRPLVLVLCAWDHRITDPMFRPGPWKLGEDAFTLTRHADGTPPHWTDIEDLARPRCPKCKAYDTLTTAQEAYGDRTTCTAAGCDYHNWYDIGD